jgi:hypothetical protein
VSGAETCLSTVLAEAPLGKIGWTIPIEPLLRVQDNRHASAPVLAMLHQRAK